MIVENLERAAEVVAYDKTQSDFIESLKRVENVSNVCIYRALTTLIL